MYFKICDELVIKRPQKLILISPFVSIEPVKYIGDNLPQAEITLITRFDAGTFLADSSDISAMNYIVDQSNWQLVNVPRLHAKAYIADDRAFIGSANLTFSALAYSKKANIELIAEISSDHHVIRDLLLELEHGSSIVDREQVKSMETIVNSCISQSFEFDDTSPPNWRPSHNSFLDYKTFFKKPNKLPYTIQQLISADINVFKNINAIADTPSMSLGGFMERILENRFYVWLLRYKPDRRRIDFLYQINEMKLSDGEWNFFEEMMEVL